MSNLASKKSLTEADIRTKFISPAFTRHHKFIVQFEYKYIVPCHYK